MPKQDESEGLIEREEQRLISEIIRAFGRLSFSRPIGMTVGTIMLSEMIHYWQHVEKLVDELDDWIDMIQALDVIFIDYHKTKK